MDKQDDQLQSDSPEIRGWIKLWRKAIESQVFRNDGLWKVWTWCLFRATHVDTWVPVKIGKGSTEVFIRRGQFVFGRKTASRALNADESTVYKRMAKLKSMGNLDIKSNTHYSVVTVLNYNHYQGGDDDEGNRQVTGNNNIFSKIPQKSNRQSDVKSNTKCDEIGLKNTSNYKGGPQKSNRQSDSESNSQVTAKAKNGNTDKKGFKNIKKEYCVEGEPLRLANLLLTEIQRNKETHNLSPFKQPDLQAWAREINLMICRDGRPPERIREVILWCQSDPFWWKNILSARKLRERFDRLEAEMAGKREKLEEYDPYKDVEVIGGR